MLNCTVQSRARGFTLVEMALVLLVLGLLTRAALLPLASVLEHRNRQATHNQLQEIKQAMLAHVVAYGALPCPVRMHTGDAAVVHDQPGTALEDKQQCRFHEGGVPAVALGLPGSLSNTQALLDPWGREYIYSVSLSSHAVLGNLEFADWTTPGEAARVGVPNLSADITLCTQATGNNCPAAHTRVDQIAFLVLSLGKEADQRGHQGENQDGDRNFVLHSESQQPEDFFDDQLVWGTASDLMYWLLRMGWLP
jgi:prepilin-type N-terminal cleavage/methylation domain-containing protein